MFVYKRFSAAPEKSKIQTVTNEFLRRLKNRSLKEEIIEDVLKDFVCDLRREGFPAFWIRNCLDAATRGYTKMISNQVKGISPINRPEHLGKKGRLVKTLTGKSSWFKPKKKEAEAAAVFQSRGRRPKKSPLSEEAETSTSTTQQAPETVLFIPFTLNCDLRKILQKTEDDLCKNSFRRVKFVETLGQKLNQQLANTAPWKNQPCGRSECPPCKTKPGSCRRRNCTHTVKCEDCNFLYRGETHRTFYDRSMEHHEDLKKFKEENPLVKHTMIHHQGITPSFTFEVNKAYKTSLSRQIGEAIMINSTDQSKLMNSKSEFGMNAVPRVVIEDPRSTFSSSTSEASPEAPNFSEIFRKQQPLQRSQKLQDGNSKRKRTRVETLEVVPAGDLRNFFLQPTSANLSLLDGPRSQGNVCRRPAPIDVIRRPNTEIIEARRPLTPDLRQTSSQANR